MPINNPLLLDKHKIIHIIGIGGLGMSAIAKLLFSLGYQVQGSDQLNADNLGKLNIKIFLSHHESNIEGVDLIIKSSAIPEKNIELTSAIKRNIPIITRKEILAELIKYKHTIAISGTHGKTTTTSILGVILDTAQYDPTIISGGIMNLYQDNVRIGNGNWNVVEADESDGTFLALQKSISIVTNIEMDHIEYYHSDENLFNHFDRFISSIPFYGYSILCKDNINIDKISLPSKQIITYGIKEDELDLRIINIVHDNMKTTFDIVTSKKLGALHISNIIINVPGIHNVYNASAAICAALKLGVSPSHIRQGLNKYSGVKQRFSIVGQFNYADVIEDYAHHPTAIIATINAAKKLLTMNNKIIAVIQPHRYSRVKKFFNEYINIIFHCDYLIFLDVFAAGEKKIENYNSKSLVAAMQSKGIKYIRYIKNIQDLPEILANITNENDQILLMSAGKINLSQVLINHH